MILATEPMPAVSAEASKPGHFERPRRLTLAQSGTDGIVTSDGRQWLMEAEDAVCVTWTLVDPRLNLVAAGKC